MQLLRRLVRTAAALFLACAAFAVAPGASAAEPAAAEPWVVEFGPAAAAGTYHFEDSGTEWPETYAVFTGQMSNDGDECYSVWFEEILDVSWPEYTRVATLCETGTVTTEEYRVRAGSWYTNISVYLCEGTTSPWDLDRDTQCRYDWIITV